VPPPSRPSVPREFVTFAESASVTFHEPRRLSARKYRERGRNAVRVGRPGARRRRLSGWISRVAVYGPAGADGTQLVAVRRGHHAERGPVRDGDTVGDVPFGLAVADTFRGGDSLVRTDAR